MSVLHLLGSPGDGGAETYFIALLKALQRGGVDQAAAIRAHGGRAAALTEIGVPTRMMRYGGPLDILTRFEIVAYAKARRANLLLSWMNRASRNSPTGPWARVGRLGGYYKLKNYRAFDQLVANTQDIRRWVIEQGWPEAKVRYIPNFATAPSGAIAIDRAELDTPKSAPVLLSPGRLHPAKAHDVGLKALARLPGAYLWIAGSGPLEAQLKALALSLGVADRVRFLGWRSDISRLYLAADICLFPSRFEPLGNVVIQAWAHDLPIVAAASQGPGALIHDGVDGLLAPVDDEVGLADQARRLIEDRAFAAQLAAAGRARGEAEFGETAVVGQWKALFSEYGAA